MILRHSSPWSQLEWIGDYSQHQVSKELLLSLCSEQLDSLTTSMSLNYIPVGLLMEMNTFRNRSHYSVKTFVMLAAISVFTICIAHDKELESAPDKDNRKAEGETETKR